MRCLLWAGAAQLPSHGGCTPGSTAAVHGHTDVAAVLACHASADSSDPASADSSDPAATPDHRPNTDAGSAAPAARRHDAAVDARPARAVQPAVRVVIASTADHPGAGSGFVDGCFAAHFLARLDALFARLATATLDPTDASMFR